MGTRKLKYKTMKASIAVGDELVVPYNDSEVFADIEGDEIFVLIKNKKDPNKFIKLFFRDSEEPQYTEIIEEKIEAEE